MPSVMIFIQFLQDPNGPHVELLREAGLEVRFPPRPDISDEEENIRVLQGISATIAGGEPYSRRVMAALPDLRVISRWGVGVDRVDLEAVTDSNAVVAITPSANHEAVAEHAVALLLAVSRFLVQRNDEIHRGLWERRCSLPLREKTLGLVGLGRIGRSVAVRAEAFRMRLLAHEAFPDREFARSHGIELVDLDSLLARSDYVSAARSLDRRDSRPDQPADPVTDEAGSPCGQHLPRRAGGGGGPGGCIEERPPGRGRTGRFRAGAHPGGPSLAGTRQRPGQRSHGRNRHPLGGGHGRGGSP